MFVDLAAVFFFLFLRFFFAAGAAPFPPASVDFGSAGGGSSDASGAAVLGSGAGSAPVFVDLAGGGSGSLSAVSAVSDPAVVLVGGSGGHPRDPEVRGGLEEEVRVRVDPQKLAAHGLSPAAVAQRLAQENLNASGGLIREGSTEYLVRTLNEFRTVEEIEDLPLVDRGEAVIRVRDVARVVRTHKKREVVTRLNGAEAVDLHPRHLVDQGQRCGEEDPHITPEGKPPGVLDVQIHHLLKRGAVLPAHLPETRQAGLHPETCPLLRLVTIQLVRSARTRSDEAHLAPCDMDQLGKLIESQRTNPAGTGQQPGIHGVELLHGPVLQHPLEMLLMEGRMIAFHHGAELQAVEAAPPPAHPLLPEENTAG